MIIIGINPLRLGGLYISVKALLHSQNQCVVCQSCMNGKVSKKWYTLYKKQQTYFESVGFCTGSTDL